MSDWTPPATLEEKIKRALVPPRLELARIVRRELRKGEPELRLAPMLADPSRAALDVGANRGIWSHQLAKVCARVFAFEPNPKMFAVLQAAAPANVVCRQIAASDKDGEARLLVPGSGKRYSNQHGSLNPAKVEGLNYKEVAVRAQPLDGMDLPSVGFIKIDVEGHEAAVVEGAKGLIARDKPVLVVEIEARHAKSPVRALTDRIEAMGYRMVFLNERDILTDGRFFDEASMQAQPGAASYVNNFIFLPA